MKYIYLILSLLIFLVIQPVQSQNIIHSDDYLYRYTHNYAVSIAGSMMGTPNTSWTKIKFNPKNRRIRNHKNYMKVRYHKSSCIQKTDKLIFLIPGIGARANSGRANYFAHQFKKNCSDVVILPSSFTAEFAIAASSTGVVGDSVQDAKDYYELFSYTVNYLKRTRNVNYKKFSIFSYSLGSLHSAHIARLDLIHKRFNFDKILLVNTPNDILHSLRLIDNMVRDGRGIRSTRRLRVLYRLARSMYAGRRYIFTPRLFHSMLNRVGSLSLKEQRYTIGKALTFTLKEVVLASQAVIAYEKGRDLGVLPHFRYEDAREDAAKKFTMMDYVYKILFLYKNRYQYNSSSITELNDLYSLNGLRELIKNQENIYLAHNADDFLLGPEDKEYYAEIFGDRFYLYPRGGHCGNMWYQDNLSLYMRLMK